MPSDSARVVLGFQLRYLRELNKISLTAVAKALGKTPGHISNIEAGRDRPSWDVIAYYEEQFHADGSLWSAFVDMQTGARPPQRVNQTDKPNYPIPGDATMFVADVTIPDGTIMPPLFIFEKVWRIRNTGTVPWVGRRLARRGAAAGLGIPHSPAFVPIDDTLPGETVDLAVPVRAQLLAGTSQARWKMVDENGWEYFPDRYPSGVFLTIVVEDGAAPPDLQRRV